MPKSGWSTLVSLEGKPVRMCKACGQSAYRKPLNCAEPRHRALHESQIKASHKYYKLYPDRIKAYMRKYAVEHREQVRIMQWRGRLRREYGLSIDDINRMLVDQKFACAICRVPFAATPHVDHDHKTGNVRGLLCPVCNIGTGWVEKMSLDRTEKYLMRSRS
jgi:hypothetical protein